MIERTSAIVLRRTNYGEADRILQLLTPEGKISALARGVRRQNSKLAGSIELFSISDMVIRRGKSDLGIITSARAVHFYRHILEDYDRLEFGYEAIKQVSKSSEMVNEPDWYDILKEVFMGEKLLCRITGVEPERITFNIEYEIIKENNETAVKGTTKMAVFDYEKKKIARIPKEFLEKAVNINEK